MISLRKVFVILISILAFGYFISFLLENIRDIPPIDINATTITAFAALISLATGSIVIAGLIWHILLKEYGVHLSWFNTQNIFMISQFAKYIPGNIGQHVGRVFMAQNVGIPTMVTLNTMLIEVLWGASIGFGLAALSLLFYIDINALNLNLKLNAYQLITIFILLLMAPWIGIQLINSFLPSIAKRLSHSKKILIPRLSTALIVSGLFFCCFLILGLMLKIQALWLFNVTDGGILELTCLFAIAWIAGYITPGAPGGLGVREAVMVLVLSPLLGPGVALGLSITMRITTTIGDGIAFLLGHLLNGLYEKNE